MDTEVIVVGSGPTGLLLANELALAGIDVFVLDRLSERSGQSKALNLQPRTAEVLDSRGLLTEARQRAMGDLPGGHFAGLPVPLSYAGWESSHPYQIGIPQARVEEVLERRLADYRIAVHWNHELTEFQRDDHGVTAVVHTPDGARRISAQYLVGCDGSRSAVRKQLDVGFPGTDNTRYGVVADVVVSGASISHRWRPLHEMLQARRPNNRFAALIPLAENGLYRLVFSPAAPVDDPRSPVSTVEVESALTRMYGEGISLHEVRWASRFGNAARQVDQYRVGRVLLAGDAAHIHTPAGGQGLNLGIQDAMNLGWKLASDVRGRAPRDLLDTYHTERHPVGAGVLANTRAQGVLMSDDAEIAQLRELFAELMELPEVNRRLAGMVSGLDIRYDVGGPEHPLLGRRFPDQQLHERQCWVSDLLHAGHGLLLSTTSLYDAHPWSDTVRTVVVSALPGAEADAVLIRPDGYVCWVASEGDRGSAERLEQVLRRWFGDPC